MKLEANLIEYDGEYLYYKTKAPPNHIVEKQQFDNADIEIYDKSKITAEQRRKIFALVSDITEWWFGAIRKSSQREALRQLKLLYIINSVDSEKVRRVLTQRYCELVDIDIFSLSNIDISTARDFIDWIVEKCIEFDIPCNDSLANYAEDIDKLVYMCCINRRCIICNKKHAHLHHCTGSRIGMGFFGF